MITPRFAIAVTALGAFGVVWTDAGIVRTWMHDRTPERTRHQVRRAFPNAEEAIPPTRVAATMAEVEALLAGERRAPISADLDSREVPDFDRRVYEVARTVPPGETITYGAIAKLLGEEPMRARDVGQALARNPFAPIVPCHRVVAAGGKLGGYSAPGGATTKRRLLELEGAVVAGSAPPEPGLFDLPLGAGSDLTPASRLADGERAYRAPASPGARPPSPSRMRSSPGSNSSA